MMRWKKLGLIYNPDGHLWWAKTHAMIPTPEVIYDEVIRIYLTCCDNSGIGRVGYVEVDANAPSKILLMSSEPVLDIGIPGTFDENGVLQCSIVNLPDGRKFLYYVGFELGAKIRYRLLSGLAISNDGGISFQRIKQTPVLERASKELFFRCGPFCSFDAGRFRMWYVAGSSWMEIDGKMMPVYTVNYLESYDGIQWGEEGKVCINIERENEHGFGRPYVINENGFYRMFYSIRKKHIGYRLGYAESEDGISWIRKDDEVGIDVSEIGWDSEMICYSAILKVKDKVYMFYNGNEFGKTGFGYAVLDSWD